MPRFAANLGFMFADRPTLERFGAAAAAGFKAVEAHYPYDVPASAMRREIDRHGLAMLGLNTAMGKPPEFGLGAVPGRERDFAAQFDQALDYVVTMGGNAVHCMAGIVPPEERPAAERVFLSNLKRCAERAGERNVTILIEPINTRDRPDYFLSRTEHAADIVGKLGLPNVKIQYDFYHNQIMGGDLIKRFEKFRPLIGHVQIAAVPSRHEPDEGEVNYPAIYRALDALGYDGWIAAEYIPRGKTEDGLAWARPYGVVPKG